MKNISNNVSVALSNAIVVVIVNTKGGSSKSTNARQVGGAYALDKGLNAKIWEFEA